MLQSYEFYEYFSAKLWIRLKLMMIRIKKGLQPIVILTNGRLKNVGGQIMFADCGAV